MSTRNQLYCAYCGWGFFFLFILGWAVIGGFVPPPDPNDAAQVVAQRFARDRNSIRFGVLLCLFGSALVLPWYAAIVTQVKRIEGRDTPIAWIQLGAGACLTVEFLFPLMFWATAAYRQDTSDETVQRLNDLAWLPFLGLAMTTVIAAISFGVVVLQDRREVPIFPRWFGYYNVWLGTLLSPAGLIIFFKDGPFAWDGLISFWMVFFVFAAWAMTLTVMVIRAVKRQALDGPDRTEAQDDDVAELAAEMVRVKARLESMTAEIERLSSNDPGRQPV